MKTFKVNMFIFAKRFKEDDTQDKYYKLTDVANSKRISCRPFMFFYFSF